MTLKYVLARLKRALRPSLACAAAICVIMLTMTVAAAVPSMISSASVSLSRQLAGSADISVAISDKSSDRFFALSRLRDNPEIRENSEFITGYFELYTQLTAGEKTAYCTLYAADYASLDTYNPIAVKNKPSTLGNADIIIGKVFAEKHGISVFDRIELRYGGQSPAFTVVAAAEKEGLFFAGDVVLISSEALRRLSPMLGSDLVTRALIGAKNTQGAEDMVLGELGKDARAASNLDIFQAPSILVGVVAAAFCAVSLAALMRLLFAKDRENLSLLRTLGLRKSQAAAITVISGAVICLIAIAGAVLLDFFILTLLRAASPLFRTTSFGILPRLIGYGLGLVTGFLSMALFGVRERGSKKKVPKDIQSFFVFIMSLVLAIGSLFVLNIVPLLGSVMAVAAAVGIIVTAPSLVPLLSRALHRKRPGFYWLRLSSFSGSSAFRRFSVFLMLGSIVIMMLMSSSFNMRQVQKQAVLYPFEVVVTGIQRPDEKTIQSVRSVESVESAVKGITRYCTLAANGGIGMNANLVGLEADGFRAFGADFSVTERHGGTGVVIGGRLAMENRLQEGDVLQYTADDYEVIMTVAGILNTHYLDGNFVLADLSRFATEARPYTEIFVKAVNGQVQQTLNSVALTVSGRASVLELAEMGRISTAWFGEFVWLIDLFGMIMTVLCAASMLFLTAMRRAAYTEETERLKLLGLKRETDIRHTLFAIAVALIPFILFAPFLLFLLTEASFPLFFAMGVRVKMRYKLIVSLITALIAACFAIGTETAACRIGWKQKKGNISKTG